MGSKYDILRTPPKALTFDVFGTVTVTETLIRSAATKDPPPSLTDEDWAEFAQSWRNAYKKYVSTYHPEATPFKDIDTHHHESLIALLAQHNLTTLYTPSEIHDLSRIWHFLTPWPDSATGISHLNKSMTTSTLSNGTQSLLSDLNTSGHLGFKKIMSSGDFGAFKPHPSVYKGAVKELGCEAGEVAMVAAHLGDLKAARGCGMRTIYVEREGEEDWEVGGKDWVEAREWVDLWVSKEEEGFVEVARRFGLV